MNSTLLFLDATAFLLNTECVEGIQNMEVDIVAESAFVCPHDVVTKIGKSANTGVVLLRKTPTLVELLASMESASCSLLCCEQQIFNEVA